MLIQNWIQQIIIDADLMKIRSVSNHGPNQLWFDLSTVQPKRQIIAGKPCIFVTNLLSGFLLLKVLFSSSPKRRIIAVKHFPCISGLPCLLLTSGVCLKLANLSILSQISCVAGVLGHPKQCGQWKINHQSQIVKKLWLQFIAHHVGPFT